MMKKYLVLIALLAGCGGKPATSPDGGMESDSGSDPMACPTGWSDHDSDPSTPCIEVVSSCDPGYELTAPQGYAECSPCSAGSYCPGGSAGASACDGTTYDHDDDPVTPCSIIPGSCSAGTYEVLTANGYACVSCAVGQYCAGGAAAPIDCASEGKEDVDSDPSTLCEIAPGSCIAGTAETGTGPARSCSACSAGYYCAGGVEAEVLCSSLGLEDHDSDPSTMCAQPPGTCPSGTYEDSPGGVPACVACAVGTYCAGGLASEIPCGAGTWDDDSDASTICATHTDCPQSMRMTSEGTATMDIQCEACSPHRIAEYVNASSCDLFSHDGVGLAQTYSVEIVGVVLAPFDQNGEEWDSNLIWNQVAKDLVLDVGNNGTLAEAVTLASDFTNTHGVTLPEVWGRARLKVRGFPEWYSPLTSAAAPQATLTPTWTGKGFSHVPLTDETRMLIALFDGDVSTDDALTYVMLDGSLLQQAANLGEDVSVRVMGRSGSRALWVSLRLVAEDATGSQLAPTAMGSSASAAAAVYSPLTGTAHSLWIHGLDFLGGGDVVPPVWSEAYWTGDMVTLRGPDPRPVNYHGHAYVSVSNVVLQYEMDSWCRAPDSCYLVCHSAGCAQSGYALDLHSNLGTRWNVNAIVGAGSAAGGSELADNGDLIGIGGFLTRDLVVATMRGLYNHDGLGVPVEYAAGASGGFLGQSLVLPGQDDNAVAYHSSGGIWFDDDFGNPGDPSPYTLPTGHDAMYMYFDHYVFFRDDLEQFNHTGIKTKLESRMILYEP